MGCIISSKFNKNNSIEDDNPLALRTNEYLLKMSRNEFEILCDKAKDDDEVKFEMLCDKAKDGKEVEVLAAVDQDRRLATRHNDRFCSWDRYTLMDNACMSDHDSPNFVQGLLERGANNHALNRCWENALIYASKRGHIKTIKVLLDHGANPNYRYCNHGAYALRYSAYLDYFEVCLLLISYGAYLDSFSLEIYGNGRDKVTRKKKKCAILLATFQRKLMVDSRWKRRWPMMSVMTGCGFRPLAIRLLEMHLTSPIALDTPEHYERLCAYYMQIIFRCDGLLRRIVSFL
jgi:hypothetical protein